MKNISATFTRRELARCAFGGEVVGGPILLCAAQLSNVEIVYNKDVPSYASTIILPFRIFRIRVCLLASKLPNWDQARDKGRQLLRVHALLVGVLSYGDGDRCRQSVASSTLTSAAKTRALSSTLLATFAGKLSPDVLWLSRFVAAGPKQNRDLTGGSW